jgi:tol-pal system protein YbgF
MKCWWTSIALVVGLCLAGFAGWPAAAQDYDSLRNQIDQLRQQVRQLTGQVNDLSRGSTRRLASAVGTAAEGIAEIDSGALFAKLDEVYESMRRLNGRLEELEFKVSNLTSGLDALKRDADLRPGGAGPASAGSAASVAARTDGAASGAGGGEGGPVSLTPATDEATAVAGSYDPALGPRSLGSLPLEPGASSAGVPEPGGSASTAETPASDAAAADAGAAAGGEAAVASIAPATPKEQYDEAYRLLKNAQYAEAEAAYRSFIDKNPGDPDIEKASYWLGETFYARKNFNEASRIYARNVQQWPKGDKAPDNLVKLSLALINLQRGEEACQFLIVLETDYPNAAQNVKQAAERAKKQAKCR